MGRTDHRGGQKPYTEAELAWLKDHAEIHLQELTREFNQRFGRWAEPKWLGMKMRKMGVEPNVRAVHAYTEEEREWLLANVPELPVDEVARRFNARFGTSISAGSLKTYGLRFLNVKRTKEVTAKHRREMNEKFFTRFHVGDTSIHIRGGRPVKVIMVRDRETGPDGKHRARWIPYARYLWEQEHGALPQGWSLIPLNNDGTDCRMENWYAVPSDVMALMARNQWFSTNPDATLAAIKLCELSRLYKGVIRV